MRYMNEGLDGETDGCAGTRAFIGDLLLQRLNEFERRRLASIVLMALPDGFKVAGS